MRNSKLCWLLESVRYSLSNSVYDMSILEALEADENRGLEKLFDYDFTYRLVDS